MLHAPHFLARLALLVLLVAIAPLARAQGGTPIDHDQRGTGTAIAIGGALKPDNAAIFGRLVAAAGGPGARWVVFGTASENPVASAESMARQLRRHGAVAETLPVSPLLADRPVADAVRDPALVARVRAAQGVFFTGGAQARIVDAFAPGGVPSPLLLAIWDVYRAGGVVAGTSAGAAIMSRTMFRDAPDVLGALKGRLRDGQETSAGLGFMGSGLFIDQHALKRGRFGRMLPLMQARGERLGLAIEENSAAVLKGDTVEIIGRALVVDLADARSDAALGAFNIDGARLSLLDTGDRLQMPAGRITPSPAKLAGQVLDPATPGYRPYHRTPPFLADMLGDNVIGHAMGVLIDGGFATVEGLAFDPRPAPGDPLAALGFAFVLRKGPGSIGWTTEAGGEDYTVRDLWLQVRPVRIAQPLFGPWAR